SLRSLARAIYFPRGQFQLAFTNMEESERFSPEGSKKHWAIAFLNTYVNLLIGNRKKAREILDEMIANIHPGSQAACAYYYCWAVLSLDEEDLDKAQEYLQLAIQLANKTGMPDMLVWVRLAYARYHRYRGELSVARSWAEDGLRIAEQIGFQYFICESCIECGKLYYFMDEPTKAESYLQRAFDISGKFENEYLHARALYLLALLYDQTKHPTSSNTWIQAVKEIQLGGYAFILERERTFGFPVIISNLKSKDPEARRSSIAILKLLGEVPPPPLTIHGLGQFLVKQGLRTIPETAWQKRKAGELFRYLLLQPGFATNRDMIIDALWPDGKTSGVDLFHQATSTLRRILEEDLPDKFPSRYLDTEGDLVRLKLPQGSKIDFVIFQKSIQKALQSGNQEALQTALNQYHGDLFVIDKYADWAIPSRENYASLYTRGMIALAKKLYQEEDYFGTLSCCQQVFRIDRWNEDAVLLAMKAYVDMHNIPHAVILYNNLKKSLWEELQLQPRKEIQEYLEHIKTNG
ncbi:MAG: hypothetical protein HGA86_05565, partial [Anaerolineaceae bacterium]|nr:hypothetical protein [Anaerolineaceae bacterium]